MSAWWSSPAFGVLLTLLAFEAGMFLQKKTGLALMNPILLAILLVIAVLLLFKIPLESYQVGGSYISFLLGPATVSLAVPLYKNLARLKQNAVPILAGITAGVLTNVAMVAGMAWLLKLDRVLMLSLLPKSVTTPIGLEVSVQLGGISGLTVTAIMVTGITGVILGPVLFDFFHIRDEVARGIALGTASHALGTTRAMEMGEVEGGMSGLALGVAGLMTGILLPLLVSWIL